MTLGGCREPHAGDAVVGGDGASGNGDAGGAADRAPDPVEPASGPGEPLRGRRVVAGDAPDSARPAAGPGGRARGSRVAPVTFLAAAALGGLVRFWQMWGRGPVEWADTVDFAATARSPWTDLGLWAGGRPVGPSLLFKAVGGDGDAYIAWQAAIAVACWAALAASVVTVVAGRRPRAAAAGAVVAFSLTSPVTLWERSVLSESLALSLLALVVAAGLQAARGATRRRVAALLATLALWAAIRDSHAAVAVIGGVALLVGVAWSWARARRRSPASARAGARRRWASVGLGAVVLGLAAGWASAHGERHAFPMRNVYEVRVLPYPDRVRWFADHGMPQAGEFLGPRARPPFAEPGQAPVVYVADDDGELGRWLDWVEGDGRAAFARYVATHPLYPVTEPLRVPERTFNNAWGDRGFYAPLDVRRVPLVDGVLALPTTAVLAVAALAGGWALGRRRWSPALAAGVAAVGLAVPHGLVAWHSDGMETARHLVGPAIQLHLGVLLLVVGTARGVVDRRGQVHVVHECEVDGGDDRAADVASTSPGPH
ncbi:MAG TPA: hypothetical protein VF015_06780 [Acidimicrobiales bacterium]